MRNVFSLTFRRSFTGAPFQQIVRRRPPPPHPRDKAACLEYQRAPCLTFRRPVAFFHTETCRLGWASEISTALKNALRPVFDKMPAAKKTAVAATKTASTSKSTSRKRKMDADVEKFYAVRAGKKPGVYKTWDQCQAQISGFKGAQCRFAPALSSFRLVCADLWLTGWKSQILSGCQGCGRLRRRQGPKACRRRRAA